MILDMNCYECSIMALINGTKYIELIDYDKHITYPYPSLEDEVYFVLRNIFWNADIRPMEIANDFNHRLTNGVSFHERTEQFNYSNVLYDDNDFTKELYEWLCTLITYKDLTIEFTESESELDMNKYMKFDDFLFDVECLIEKLKGHLEKS